MSRSSWTIRVACLQGAWNLITGIWPLVSIGTFELVTGDKTDEWLVKTVGALIAVVGLVLLSAGYHRRVTFEIALAGAATAGALLLVDVIYVAQRVIAPIYLLDASIETLLVAAWLPMLRSLPRISHEKSSAEAVVLSR